MYQKERRIGAIVFSLAMLALARGLGLISLDIQRWGFWILMVALAATLWVLSNNDIRD